MSSGTTKSVSAAWSIISGSSYASISSTGALTAYSTTSQQSVTIKASYTEGGITKTATKTVTISASAPATQSSLTYAKTHELGAEAQSPLTVGLTLGGGGFSINSATFSTSASWIRYSGYALKNSDLTLEFKVDANIEASQRTATFSGVINGESVTITFLQAGQGQTSGGNEPTPPTSAATTGGSMSQFEISSGVMATIAGMSGVTWGDFNSTDYFGAKTFVSENIPDAEKSISGFTISTMGAEDGWCGPLSDMDALYWTGWAQTYTPGYATVEDMADYFRARPYLLRTWSSYDGPVEGTYGYDGLFDWFKDETGINVSQHVTWGTAQGVSFARDVQTLLGDGSHVMRIDLLFDPVVNNPKWTWVNSYGGTLHAVLCVGFAIDSAKSADDPARLPALFIVDPDNDQSAGNGGRSAPNSIVYCPVTWNGDNCVVSGIWGQSSVVYGAYAALANCPTTTATDGNSVAPGVVTLNLNTSIAGILQTDFAKAQSPQGALVGADGSLAGTVQIKAGKATKRGIVKISAMVVLVNGKKVSSKPLSLNVGSGARSGKLVFKEIGEMDFEMAADGSFTLKSGSYAMAGAKVGGNLPNGKMTFAMAIDALPAVDAGFVVLGDLLPGGVELTLTGGKKINAGKAAAVKYTKDKASGQFSLVGLDDPNKPNLSGLKLSYTPKTGVFKGSFNMYATNEGSVPAGRAPKLKKYRVGITGFMVNDGSGLKGVGKATCKKPAVSWNLTVE